MNPEYNRSKEIMENEINFQKVKEEIKQEEENIKLTSIISEEEEEYFDEIINDDYKGTAD